MAFGGFGEPGAPTMGLGMATPVLGSVGAPGQGIQRPAGLHAPEPGAQGTGRKAGGLAVVELQQLRARQEASGLLPNSD